MKKKRIKSQPKVSRPYENFRRKVNDIFVEVAGERAKNLKDFPHELLGTITTALKNAGFRKKRAWNVAFHLTDWNYDAAFLVALHLFPERFTAKEISAGIDCLLAHAPAHVNAAARLFGHSADDFFARDETNL